MKQLTIKHIESLGSAANWREKIAVMRNETNANPIDTINWEEYAYRPEVAFHIAWHGKSLYLVFEVQEKDVRAVNRDYHSPVYEDSCVEFFLQHEGESIYRNFEFNCIGTALSSIRRSRSDCDYFSSRDMNRIATYASLSKEGAGEEASYHWQLLAEIPFDLIGLNANESPSGKSIQANCYKCGDKTKTPHYLSWNPIHTEQPNFHCPDFFGKMVFE